MDELRFTPKDHDPKVTGSEQFDTGKHNWMRGNKVPALVLNATTVNTGRGWQFTPTWMGESPWPLNEGADNIERLEWANYNTKDGGAAGESGGGVGVRTWDFRTAEAGSIVRNRGRRIGGRRMLDGISAGADVQHTKEGLDSDTIRLPFSKEMYQIERTVLSPSGVRKEYQKALAELRTDLDAFSLDESRCLMRAGTKWRRIRSESIPLGRFRSWRTTSRKRTGFSPQIWRRSFRSIRLIMGNC
jgi:hypothetical protein